MGYKLGRLNLKTAPKHLYIIASTKLNNHESKLTKKKARYN